MKHIRLMVLIMASSLLASCATQTVDAEKVSAQSEVNQSLTMAANNVFDELSKMNSASEKPKTVKGLSYKDQKNISGCSSRIVSVDFDGDVMLFVDDAVKSKICKVRVIGKKPAQDIILSLHHKHQPLWRVFEDAGYQMGNLGDVEIDHDSVIIKFNNGV